MPRSMKYSYISLLFLFFHFSSLLIISSCYIYENNCIKFQFHEKNGQILQQFDKLTQKNLLILNEKKYQDNHHKSIDHQDQTTTTSTISEPLWEISFVDNFGEILITNIDYIVSYNLLNNPENTLEIIWKNITIERNKIWTIVDVKIELQLPENSSIASFLFFVDMVDGSPLGIWQTRISIPYTIGSMDDGELFFPSGFGTTYVDPVISAGSGINSLYPGSYAAMQYMSLGAKSSPVAGYFAAHDSHGTPKLLEYSTSIASTRNTIHLSSFHDEQNSFLHSINPKVSLSTDDLESIQELRTSDSGTPIISYLRITIYPENAGVALSVPSSWQSSYSLALGIVRDVSSAENRPMWFEAAQIYREWVLASAEWTKSGPLSTRTNSPPLPSWYRQNHIWINSHWQCHDIFNETGGDPNFIVENTKSIAKLFDQKSLALHWYEWQQGPDPTPEGRYKFDTHYPDYFPPRPNFYETVASLLKEDGVFTFPYINGRIFDINSDSYLQENGQQYCAKKTSEKIIHDIDSVNNLESYIETYGSDATFCVANPITPYWQQKVSEVVDELVNKYQVSGVYIDQIGAATPKLCWDSKHQHTLGGGLWWRDGYIQMLQSIATKTSAPMVTEDNAEPYMDSLHGYLTLVAFKSSLVVSNGVPSSSSTGYRIISPAFPAIYGGYYVGFGAQWYQLDFDDHDWWCGKLAATFVTGTQMGWFSLLGISDDPLDSCGNMAVNDLLLDDANADLIDFLKILAKQRGALVDYFVDGHLIRSLGMSPLPQILTQTISSGGYPLLDYQSVSTTSWRLDSTQTTMTVLVSSTPQSFETDLQINFQNWGYENVEELKVFQIQSNGERAYLTSLHGPKDQLPIVIPGRNVIALEFQPH